MTLADYEDVSQQEGAVEFQVNGAPLYVAHAQTEYDDEGTEYLVVTVDVTAYDSGAGHIHIRPGKGLHTVETPKESFQAELASVHFEERVCALWFAEA